MANSIRIAGIDDVDLALKNLEKIPPQAIRDLAQFIYDRAREGAGKHVKTGALEQSTFLRKIPGGWEVGHDRQRAPHAIFVHWGTRPHVIKPNKRQALRFTNSGAFVFTKGVKHPGYEGDPWLIRAVDQASRNFETIVKKSIRKAAP